MSLLDVFADLQIPLEDVKNATNNFADENIIGRGGFGRTYKGQLFHDGQLIDIAARKLEEKYGQGSKEFWTEILMLSSLKHQNKHQNLVDFIGFCFENNEKILVNKYEAKGSLDMYLNDPTLKWTQRLEICVGVARALRYIYYDDAHELSVVHSNIKSSKILLNDSWEPKLAGFERSMNNTKARRHSLFLANPGRTIRYVDPKYEVSGGVSHKSDVYSFGVVLFEVLCGKSAFHPNDSQLDKQHLSIGKVNEFGDLDQTEGPPQLGKQHSVERKLNKIGDLDQMEGCPQLGEQDSFERKVNEIRDFDQVEGPPQLGEQDSFKRMVNEIGDIDQVEGPPQLGEQDSCKRVVSEIGDFDQVEGPPQLGEQDSFERKVNEIGDFDQVEGPPQLGEQDSFERKVNEIGDFKQVEGPPQLGEQDSFERKVNEIGDFDQVEGPPQLGEQDSFERKVNEIGDFEHVEGPPQLGKQHSVERKVNEIGDLGQVEGPPQLGEQDSFERKVNEIGDFDQVEGPPQLGEQDSCKRVVSEIGDFDQVEGPPQLGEQDSFERKVNEIGDFDQVEGPPQLGEQDSFERKVNEIGDFEQVEGPPQLGKQHSVERKVNEIGDLGQVEGPPQLGEQDSFKRMVNEIGDFDQVEGPPQLGEQDPFERKVNDTGDSDQVEGRPQLGEQDSFERKVNEIGDFGQVEGPLQLGEQDSFKRVASEIGDFSEQMYRAPSYSSFSSFDHDFRMSRALSFDHDVRMSRASSFDPSFRMYRASSSDSDLKEVHVTKIHSMDGPPSAPNMDDIKESYSSEEEVPEYFEVFSETVKAYRLLADLARSHYEGGTLDDMIDSSLRRQMDQKSYKIFANIAYCCLNEERTQRPQIDQILKALENALKLQLKRENDEKSTLVAKVEGTDSDSDRWKGKNLDHLKIKLNDIKLATENFSEKYLIGWGGYGMVYQAELEHYDNTNFISIEGTNKCDLPKRRNIVAIKHIKKRSDKEGEQGFIAEIDILSTCKHPNIVSLLGFCDEGPDMIIVYELASNGSLDDYIGATDKMTNFTWVQRINICLDIAHGLNYIHTNLDDKQKIIHRDIKSANILLNDKWKAMIADFGLSKSYQADQLASTINTNFIVGTKVYWDPEYAKYGRLKKASDIYSFGVILFEILCGKLAYDHIYMKENDKGLAPIARRRFEEGTIYEMLDPKLKEENDENIFTKGLNPDSLETFTKLAYECVAETQNQRPTMEIVIEELKYALYAQENRKPNLKISLEDIKLATKNFSVVIGGGGFGRVYRGEVTHANGCSIIAAKRLDRSGGHGEHQFRREIEILLKFKHENVIGFVGYCDETDEKVIVYEYASRGTLDKHLNSVDLTWMKRLQICIEVATVLEFFHGDAATQSVVLHRDIKSSNILLMEDWKAKLTDFGLSLISSINGETNYVIDNVCGTMGYVDPVYVSSGFLTKESDIYSFGMVLLDVLWGKVIYNTPYGRSQSKTPVIKRLYEAEEGTFDEMVFDGIKKQIVPNSLATFKKIAYQCLNEKREQRPKAGEVVGQLKKALDFQMDYEKWEPNLPNDYNEIIQISNSPKSYSDKKKEDLHNIFSNGILLQQGNTVLSFIGHGERNELISATKFEYRKHSLHKWRSLTESRFHKVAEMLDISNLMIKIEPKPQFLSPDVVYGVHLLFKFCELRDSSSKPIYVNLKYKMGEETLHSYFATQRDPEWMMIELYQFLNQKDNVEFTFKIESLSVHYCGDDAIYVEGIEFRALNKVEHEEIDKVKEVQRAFKSNLNTENVQQILRTEDEKLFSLSEVNGKKHLMLSATVVFNSFSDLNFYELKPSSESRFQEIIELLPQQVFCINCKIESQKLSCDTEYVCFLVFKLSKQSQAMHYPIKVRDLLHRKNKEPEIIYLTTPNPWNLHYVTRVPKERGDGWMEVHVSKFDLNRELEDHCLPVNLKFISYEGTMPGIIVSGLEFRPV